MVMLRLESRLAHKELPLAENDVSASGLLPGEGQGDSFTVKLNVSAATCPVEQKMVTVTLF